MGRKRTSKPIGPILAENLARLGYGRYVINAAEVAKLVAEKTGKPISRQRIAQIVNAVNVSDETIALLSMALEVDPSELTREAKR